jgi:DNA replication protein DnaC
MQKNIDDIAFELAGNLSADQVGKRWQALEEKKWATPEKTEQENEYWQKVFSEDQAKPFLYVARPTKQEMTYEDARKKVWALMQLRAAHISQLENREFNWVFDDEERKRNANIVKYFINDPTCEFPLSKGLFFYGMPGTCKTEIMTAMERFCRENELSKSFELGSLSKIYVQAKSDTNFDPITSNIQFDRAFDELGRYAGPVKRFGDDLDINEGIVEQRYERMRRYGQLTHFIANLTPNDLQNVVSPMLFDRLRSMCTGVYFKGQSKRS